MTDVLVAFLNCAFFLLSNESHTYFFSLSNLVSDVISYFSRFYCLLSYDFWVELKLYSVRSLYISSCPDGT